MGERGVKGTVTPLSSVFPVAETQKAAKRVEEALEEKQKEMNRLKEFIDENSSLVNLVVNLPNELHHDIIVPFGKGAFFPGRLIHTNEFMVLLGEGYYAERTAKQTVDILMRREKSLEYQVNSLKANIEDLRAEASFFGATALDSAEGLVEIREEYIEENSADGLSVTGLVEQNSKSSTKADNLSTASEMEEYARMISRMDELEKEELAANLAETDGTKASPVGDDWDRVMSRLDEFEKEELAAQSDEEEDKEMESDSTKGGSDENEEIGTDFDSQSDDDHNSLRHNFTHLKEPQRSKPTLQTKDTTSKELSSYYHHEDLADKLNCTGLTVEHAPTGKILHSRSMKPDLKTPKPSERKVRFEVEDSSVKKKSTQTSESGYDSSKAFTGSIVEHAQNLKTNSQQKTTASSQFSGSQPSKPMSRFKMQRK